MTQTIPYPEQAMNIPLNCSGGRLTHEHDIRAVIWLISNQMGNVAEISCGDGISTKEIASTFSGKTVFAIYCHGDLDSESIARACVGVRNVVPVIKQSQELSLSMFKNVRSVLIDGSKDRSVLEYDSMNSFYAVSKNGGGILIWNGYGKIESVTKCVDGWNGARGLGKVFWVEGTAIAFGNVEQEK